MPPSHDRLAAAKEVFADALERPGPERGAYVERACAGDPELRGMVGALLDAHGAAARFMDSPSRAPDAAGASTVPAAGTEHPGAMIGPYKLLEQIGEGGFGVVFMAEQERPVVRRVALKIIKAGMDTRQVIARFEAERQALAMMDHPNIARVLDAGATETGRPYFVMELVRGDPITEYCDKNNLSTAERLALFTDICHAVQHAHQKGIIHRDLKPSNVLVTLFDGRPIPKVIDFGIAKAMNQRLTDKTLFTAHRQLIGTPQYMSPEQAEMSGVDIDTRSDIYSLGVLLYELLTGTTPFDPEHLRSAALAEVQRIIREEEPPKPSTRLSSLQTLSNAAPHRRTDAARLSASVRGDLDWIVMKCLEKDRTRRYETANGLALDVQRHAAGEPVLAAPPSRAYRARKFIRRNRSVVTTGLFVAAALLLGLAGTTVGLLQADARRQEAEEARREADARRQETARIADFQAQMLTAINPSDAGRLFMTDLRTRLGGALASATLNATQRDERLRAFERELRLLNATDAAATLIARTMLEPAAEAVDREFSDQPLVDAALRQTLADLYARLGRFDAAAPLQEAALRTRRRLLGDDHPNTIASISRAAELLKDQGRLEEADPLAREAIDRSRRALGADHTQSLACLSNAGLLAWKQGRFDRAEQLLREALDGRRRVLGDDHADTIGSITDMVVLLQAVGRLKEAEPYATESLERARRVLGPDNAVTLKCINNLAMVLQDQGRLAEAEPYCREGLETSRRVHGDDHPDTVIFIANLGTLLQHMNRPAEAEPYCLESLERSRRTLGDDHPSTLAFVYNMGYLLRSLRRPADAEPYLREALDGYRRAVGDDHADTIWCLTDMAQVLADLGRPDEGEPYHLEAVERAHRTLGSDHTTTLRAAQHAGAFLLDRGSLDAAEPLLREAAEGYARQLGETHWQTAAARARLGRLLTARADFAEAEKLLLAAESALRAAEGTGPKHHRACIESLASLYAAWHAAEPDMGYDVRAANWQSSLRTAEPAAPPAGP